MEKFEPCVPMKYFSTKDKDLLKNALNSDEYCIQKKIDGASYALAKTPEGEVHLWGDKISKKTGEVIDKIDNVNHLKAWAETWLPKGSMIVGELYTKYNYSLGRWVSRESSKYVNSVMLALPDKANERQAGKPLHFYMFDVLWLENEPVYKKPFIERDKILTDFYNLCQSTELREWLEKAETITKDKEYAITLWLAEGCEGGVLKKLNAPHSIAPMGSSAKRPAHVSYKIKEFETIDAVIVDITMPEKEYTGKDPENHPYLDENGNPVNRLWYLGYPNAIVIGAFDKNGMLHRIGTVSSGLDDTWRKDLVDNFMNYYYMKVITVECMSIDKEEKTLRHPRAICMHTTKEAEDCLMEDIFK